MARLPKIIFFCLLAKPIVLILIGLNVIGRQKLPINGPAVIIANHNSHLDTLVLMSLFPLSIIHKVRPVAAADYFMARGKLLAWFSLNCIGIIPMDRTGQASPENLFPKCHEALDDKDILILYPEGSRGRPEQLSKIKKGIYYLVKERDDIKTVPVVMHGLGRALPKGEALFVPFNCDVVIGEKLPLVETSSEFLKNISQAFSELSKSCLTLNELDEDDLT